MQATESEIYVKRADKLRIIIADDHKIFREGLQKILESEPDIDVIAEAGTGVEALRLAEELCPNLMLVDILMPEMNGIEAIRQITEKRPEMLVIVLSMYGEKQLVIEALCAGAKGYLVKECASVELLTAIRNINSGGVYLSRKVAGNLLKEFPQQPDECNLPSSTHLSTRELEIIQLIAEGKNTKEKASFLDISVKTVESHRRNIMRKLNVNSIAELIKYAIRNKLISQ